MVRFLALTVRVFALLVADPQPFVKTARYWLPLEETGEHLGLQIGAVYGCEILRLPKYNGAQSQNDGCSDYVSSNHDPNC